MSEFRLNGRNSGDSAVAIGAQLETELKRSGNELISQGHAGQLVSMESVGGSERADLQASLESIHQGLTSAYGERRLSVAQEAAGTLAWAAGRSPVTYQEAVRRPEIGTTGKNMKIVEADEGGSAGGYGYTTDLHPSLESFDNANLTDFLGYSVAYNVEAAIQSALPEAFFRTVVVTPENGGADISIRTPYVFNWSLRSDSGAPQNWRRKRLIEAAFDYTVLADESTVLYPEVKADNSNAAYFVPAAAVAPQSIVVGPRTVRTAPLLIGKEVALVNISQGSTVARNGVADFTDVLDRANGVKEIYLQVGGASGEVLKFNISSLPRAMFVRGPEHDGREQNLNFKNNSLALNSRTLLANGGAPTNTTLDDIITDELQVNLSIKLTGEVNLDTSNAVVNAGKVEVHSVFDKDGNQLALTTGVGAAIVTGLATLTVIGWTPNSRLSNANKRERGLQLDLQTYTERYPVPMGPPMSIPAPLGENRDPEELNLLIAAVRTRNDNNAITKLFNTSDVMYAMNDSAVVGTDDNGIVQVEGIGRFLIQQPWYRRTEVDCADLTSVKTSEKIADLSAHLINQLRDGAYDALRVTGIQQALDQLTGGNGKKVKLVVGTDPTLARYLVVSGDTRTLGDGLDFEVVSHVDYRLKDTIFYAFVVEGEGMFALNFGSHLWMPELISNVSVTRNNAPIREAMVQPRSRHVVHTPILGMITVKNLHKVVTEQVLFPVKQH